MAFGQSESDAAADVSAFLNNSGQLEFQTTGGNNKLWVHTFSRSDRRADTSAVSVPPVSAGAAGYVPRGRGVFSNDLTMSGDNLANGRIVNFHGLRHKIYGFTEIANSDTYTGQAGIVATAFQPTDPLGYAKTRVTVRTSRSTTITFSTTSTFAFVSGYLHTWSKT